MSCEHVDRVTLYALQALPAAEMTAMKAHVAQCAHCRGEMAALGPVVDSFVAWPRDILRPTSPLWERLAGRIGSGAASEAPAAREDDWKEPEWREAGAGVWYQLLSADSEAHRVTLLVRLDPGAEYPPHVHAGVEELHLLHGELWIDDRKLHAGDYNRGEPGMRDSRVWSETGCTCVLVTSSDDALG